MWDTVLEILEETLHHGVLTLPFLFGAYLLLEWIEHRAGSALRHHLGHAGHYSVPLGAAIGLIPQCGFSVAASNLYAGRLISVGTLLAVFIATSDEAIPVMLASPDGVTKILPLLGLKLGLAIMAGYLADLLFFRRKQTEECHPEHCGHDEEREVATQTLCEHCGCEGGILRSTIHHTAETFLFLLLVLLVINTATTLIGDDALSKVLMADHFVSPLITAIIGLIPNCAPSVLLSELFVDGTLSLGAAVAGLASGAGLGVAMLFRINRDRKRNLLILLYLYAFSACSGIVINLISNFLA